jgi:hypothetical protein
MEIFSKYHYNHYDKNSDNDNVNNTHDSWHIATWVHGKRSCIFFSHGSITSSKPGPPHHRGSAITLRHTTLGRLLWTSYGPGAEAPDYSQHSQDKTILVPAGFVTKIPASERPQTHTLDRSATGIGDNELWSEK